MLSKIYKYSRVFPFIQQYFFTQKVDCHFYCSYFSVIVKILLFFFSSLRCFIVFTVSLVLMYAVGKFVLCIFSWKFSRDFMNYFTLSMVKGEHSDIMERCFLKILKPPPPLHNVNALKILVKFHTKIHCS